MAVEVAQACLRDWRPKPASNEGIYLEVYVELKRRSCHLGCACRRLPRCSSAQRRVRCRTGIVEESEEMLWRSYNEENFLVPLFCLCESQVALKRHRHVQLVAEVFRCERGRDRGELVTVLRGGWRVGVWGVVLLVSTRGARGPAAEGQVSPQLSLDLRPRSLRPFSLDLARPAHGLDVVYVEHMAPLGRATSLVPERHARHESHHTYHLSYSSSDLSTVRSLVSRKPTGSHFSLTVEHVDSQKQVSSQTNSFSRQSSAVSKLRNFLARRFVKHSDEVSRRFQDWIPRHWPSLWKSCWPCEADELGVGHDIVHLMEAEFRRDCIVAFNTLFPRVQGHVFMKLRDLALDPSSNLGFKPLAKSRFSYSPAATCSSFTVSRPLSAEEAVRLPTLLVDEPGSLPWISSSMVSVLWRQAPKLSSSTGTLVEEAEGRRGRRSPFTFLSVGTKFGGSESTSWWKRDSTSGTTPRKTGRAWGTSSASGDFPGQAAPRQARCVRTSSAELCDDHSIGLMFLKRLWICLARCGVYYTEVANTALVGEQWPYPLASMLGHGSRVLIRLEDVEGPELMNFLLFGDPLEVDWREAVVPWPLRSRSAATHCVEVDPETGNIMERKLRVMNAADSVRNLSDGVRKKHLGLNLPIGGVGNPSPMGPEHFIGFAGKVILAAQVPTKSKVRAAVNWLSRSPIGLFSTGRRRSEPEGKSRPPVEDDISKDIKTSSSSTSSCSDFKKCVLNEGAGHSQSAPPMESSPFIRDQSAKGIVSPSRETKHSSSSKASAGSCAFRAVPNVQGGHLYIRMDDFGEQISHSRSVSEKSKVSEERRLLSERRHKDAILLEHAKLRSKLEPQFNGVGELFFACCVPRIESAHPRHSKAREGGSNGMQLLRVSSEPCLGVSHLDASPEDNRWADRLMADDLEYISPPPPSPAAVELLLRQLARSQAQLYGTACFKSVDDLYTELSQERSVLMRKDGQVLRFLEAAVLSLRWKGQVLMLTHEDIRATGLSVEKGYLLGTKLLPLESWSEAAGRAFSEAFAQPKGKLLQLLGLAQFPADCRTVVEERSTSTSYPGLPCHVKAHVLQLDVSEAGPQLRALGLLPAVSRKGPLGCDFSTLQITSRGRKVRCWRWVPDGEAQRLQRFLNMGDATAEERWARYAFQREGVVQFPPSVCALQLLLNRCGVDAKAFGIGSFKTLAEFWLELLNQVCFLQMQGGRLLRVVEATFVKLRWRPLPSISPNRQPWQLLVQMREELPGGKVKLVKKLLGTRKLRDETWEASAYRCLADDLCLSRQRLRELLRPGAGAPSGISEPAPSAAGAAGAAGAASAPFEERRDASAYTFLEEVKESPSYPGIQSLYRTHLVTFTLRPDAESLPFGAGLLGEDAATDAAHQGGSQEDFDATGKLAICRKMSTWPQTPEGTKRIDFAWVWEHVALEEVRGGQLWQQARQHSEIHRVSSVLLGLEGSAPQMRSPFGTLHDASGSSSKVSAVGNRKWRAYRVNSALQIPSDEGGIHVKITRQSFDDLVEACRLLDLSDPQVDLLRAAGAALPRRLLDKRFQEQQFFRHILGRSGPQASRAVEWMLEHECTEKSPEAVWAALHGIRRFPAILRRGDAGGHPGA